MIALMSAVLFASLLGSTHCAGMCGPFVAMAAQPSTASRWNAMGAYHLGRMLTYVSGGAIAGALGAALDLGGDIFGWQRIAGISAAVLIIVIGAVRLAAFAGVTLPKIPFGNSLFSITSGAHGRMAKLSPGWRLFAIGLLSALLPCGWLYTFMVTAAGTARPEIGALLMLVFWAGTLPMLVTLGLLFQKLSGRLAAKLPAFSACVLIVVGVLTLTQRLPAMPLAMSDTHTMPAAPDTLTHRVEELHAEDSPCCRPKPLDGAAIQ